MSINVTVTGNPVSISRGRMVTATCPCKDAQQEEFKKRRLMRLEQVRHQSKDIAENIRTRVRNEKKKQCSVFEKESEKKLKEWQARKLLELHNQYQQSLKDIGLGHKEAEVYDVIEEDLKTKRNYQARVAAERGRLARERQQKSLTRDVRSAEETRRGVYGQDEWCKCSPKKHFYTLVDKSGEGTPIQVTPKTESPSEDTSSGPALKKIVSDENLTDVTEESSSTSSETLASGGSSPRPPPSGVKKASIVQHISPRNSAGDAVERLIAKKKPAKDSSDLKMRFKSRVEEEASVNVFGRSFFDPSSSKRISSSRYRADEVSEDEPRGQRQKGKGSKSKSPRFEASGGFSVEDREKSGGKNLGRISEYDEDLQFEDGDESPAKSREKSLRKIGTKQFEGDDLKGASKSRSQRVKSMGRVKSSRDEDTEDEETEIPSKSKSVAKSRTKQSDEMETSKSLERAMKSKGKSLGKVKSSRNEDTEDEESEMPSKSKSVAKSRTKQSDDMETSKSLERAMKSKGKSLGKVKSSRNEDTEDEETEIPSKSKSVAKSRTKQSAFAMDDVERTMKSKAKSMGKVAEDSEDEEPEMSQEPSKSKSQQKSKTGQKVAQSLTKQFGDEKSKAKSLGKIAAQEQPQDTDDEDSELFEAAPKSKSATQKEKSRQKVAETRTKQSELAVEDSKSTKSKAKSLGKVVGSRQQQIDEDEEEERPSKSVTQKRKIKEKSVGQMADTDQEDVSELEVEKERGKSRSQKLTEKGKGAGRYYEGDESEGAVDDGGRGRRVSGGRGDNEREAQLIRQPSKRHSRSLSDPTTQVSAVKYPVETRISDRIKHRSATVTKPDTCDILSDELILIRQSSRPSIPSDPHLQKPTIPVQRKDTDIQVAPTVVQRAQSTTLDGAGEIPEKPVTVTLKPKESAVVGKKTKGGVERIDEGDLEVMVGDLQGEQEDFLQRMERQDREAEERGKVALQKEKTRRSYEDMMKKLPVVQKQERLSRLNVDNKPEYYMSEERLEEIERKKQFVMENAYESAFPGLKPSLITTKEVAHGEKIDREPFKVIDVTDKTRGVTVGTWDALKTKDAQCSCCPKQTKRERQLKDLLLNLQTQKELLLQEVDSLPKDSKLNELLGSLHDLGGGHKKKRRAVSPTSTTSSSPRKRSKTKCGKKSVLVLQNMSTQTSPAQKAVEVDGVATVEKATSPREKSPEAKEVCAISQKICDCKGKDTPCGHGQTIVVEDEKLCEIVIKIRENESQPEVFVEKTSKKAAGDVDVKVKQTKKGDTIEAKKSGGTWREHLSQQSTTYTSSSTSYYSPPDASVRTRQQPRLRDVLHDKQKQTNFPCRTTQTGRNLHPFIIKYIERLLTISRTTVQDLSVSSVSDVTTPTSSITEISSNNPSLVHLKKLLKRLGVTYEELHDIYGKSGKHDAILSSLSSGSMPSENDLQQETRPDSCVCDTQDERTNTSLSARVSQEDIPDEDDQNYREMMMKYAQITESCNKKICDLTEKIEKVRMEKAQIMNSSNSSGGGNEKENTTTAYLDLPNMDDTSGGGGSTAEQEKLDKMLLNIDKSLAENLKRMTSTEIREKYADENINPLADETTMKTPVEEENDFEPLLKDIPKLPKLFETCDPTKCCGNRRPPPSKGLTIAKRYNEEITTIPHELSTIMEGDSQQSTKQKSTETDIAKKAALDTETPPQKQTTFNSALQIQPLSSSSDELESLEKMLKDMGMGWAIATLRKTQEALALTSSSSSLDINIQHQRNVISDSSGSEVSLKGVLSRHLLAKISSTSSSTSETSISLLLKEFEDISAIFGSGCAARDGHRTSTPIQQLSSKSKPCTCSGGSNSSKDKASCTFHSLHSNGSV